MAMTEERKQEFLKFKQDFLQQRAAQRADQRTTMSTGRIIEHAPRRDQSDSLARIKAEEDRLRTRAEPEIIYKQREQQPTPPPSPAPDADVDDKLLTVVRGVNAMGEAANQQFDDMSRAIVDLQDQVMIANTKYAQTEQLVRELRGEITRVVSANAVLRSDLAGVVNANAVLKSELCHLRVELRQAVVDRTMISDVVKPSTAREVN
jgi:hypothetical protein